MKVEVIGNIGGRLCVFNCLETEKGKEIYEEMIKWLATVYEVHCVWHGAEVYEHDGIKYMQELLWRKGGACLYLHTKGAWHRERLSRRVRNMWLGEFTNPLRADAYFEAVSHGWPSVACPISGPNMSITRYNGFVVNAEAMERLDLSYIREDRFWYEDMWKDDNVVDIRVMKYWGCIKKTHKMLEEEFDSLPVWEPASGTGGNGGWVEN